MPLTKLASATCHTASAPRPGEQRQDQRASAASNMTTTISAVRRSIRSAKAPIDGAEQRHRQHPQHRQQRDDERRAGALIGEHARPPASPASAPRRRRRRRATAGENPLPRKATLGARHGQPYPSRHASKAARRRHMPCWRVFAASSPLSLQSSMYRRTPAKAGAKGIAAALQPGSSFREKDGSSGKIAQLMPKLSLPTPAAPAGRRGGPLRAGGRRDACGARGSPPARCESRW